MSDEIEPEYNPFDDENRNRSRRKLTIVFFFVMVAVVLYYVFNTYDVFPTNMQSDDELTGELDWVVVPHEITNGTCDVVVRVRMNITDCVIQGYY